MQARLLSQNGLIGVCSPSHVARQDHYRSIFQGLSRLGFSLREAGNLYRDAWGFSASDQERAADWNQLAADPEVELIFFGGSEGSNELLPYLDFDLLAKHPKRLLSYSDGTTLLCAAWALTGLETYYGQSPGFFIEPTPYDLRHFTGHILDGSMTAHEKASPWQTLVPGQAQGVLTGGYTVNFARLLGTRYFPFDPHEPHLLFLEDHQKFNSPAAVSALLSHIEQSDFMKTVTGLLFGHYSEEPQPQLYERLRLLGRRWGIPVACCDDFGHGACHAVLPIGRWARLDATARTLHYLESAGGPPCR